jgi:hypothetical protein
MPVGGSIEVMVALYASSSWRPRRTRSSGRQIRFGIRILSSTLNSAQLGRLVETAPSGVQWLHEIKLDGFRMSGALTTVGRKR